MIRIFEKELEEVISKLNSAEKEAFDIILKEKYAIIHENVMIILRLSKQKICAKILQK